MKTVERGRVGKRSAQVVMSLWADNDEVAGIILGMGDKAVSGRLELLIQRAALAQTINKVPEFD
jgi:hypothetical protein